MLTYTLAFPKTEYHKKIILFFILFFALNQSHALSHEQISEAKSSLIYITTHLKSQSEYLFKTSTLASGTGFIVNQEGFIITNHHVIEDSIEERRKKYYELEPHYSHQYIEKNNCDTEKLSETCKIGLKEMREALASEIKNSTFEILGVFDGEELTPANQKSITLINSSPKEDIALLKLNDVGNYKSLTLNSVFPKETDIIFSFGYPANAWETQPDYEIMATITDGRVSRILPNGVNGIAAAVVQHTAALNPGNSGGPLIDNCGNVLGINTRGAGTGLYYALSAEYIMQFLKNNHVKFDQSDKVCSSIEEQHSTYLIVGFILTLLILALMLLLYFKTSRQKIVHQIESYSKRISHFKQEDKNQWVLSGKIDGKDNNMTLKFSEEELLLTDGLIIGRQKKLCDYVVPHEKISREHIKISYQNKLIIEDLNSSNSTYINGKKLEPQRPQPLNKGDQIDLAHIITFHLQ